MRGKRKCSSHSFTIRGYVKMMMMRKKSPNTELLEVPKFKWWRCEDCVQELVSGEANDTENRIIQTAEAISENAADDRSDDVVGETEDGCADDRNDNVVPQTENNEQRSTESANGERRITSSDEPVDGLVPCVKSAKGTCTSGSKQGKAGKVSFQVDLVSEKDEGEYNTPCEAIAACSDKSKGKGWRNCRRKRKIDVSDSESEHEIKEAQKPKLRNGKKRGKNGRSSCKTSTTGKSVLEKEGDVTDPGILGSSQHTVEQQQLENVDKYRKGRKNRQIQRKERDGPGGVTNPESSQHAAQNGSKSEEIQDRSSLKMPRETSTLQKNTRENDQPNMLCQDAKENIGDEMKLRNGKKIERINYRSSLKMPKGKYGDVTNPSKLALSNCGAENKRSKNDEYDGNGRKYIINGKKSEQNDRSCLKMSSKGKGILGAENVEQQQLKNHQSDTKENVGSGVNKYYNLDISVPRSKGIVIREASNLDDQSLRRGLFHDSTPIIRGKVPLHKKLDFSGKVNEEIKDDDDDEDTESDDDIKMQRMQLMAMNQYRRALTQKPEIQTRIHTFKGVYGNQSSPWLSHGTNFQPNQARAHINTPSRFAIHTGSPTTFMNSNANMNTLSASALPRAKFWLNQGPKQVQSSTSGTTPFHNFASHPSYTRGSTLDSHFLHNGRPITNLDPHANQIIPRPQLFSFLNRTVPSAMGFNLNSNNLTLHQPLNREKACLEMPLYQRQLCKEFPTGISNHSESSRLQPVTSLYAPMPFKPQQEQQQSRRLMYAPSQLGITKPPMNYANSSGVLHKNQGSSQGKKDYQ